MRNGLLQLALALAVALPAAAQDGAPPAPPSAPAPTAQPGPPAASGPAEPVAHAEAAEKAERRRRVVRDAGPDAVVLVLLPAPADVPGANRNADFAYLSPLTPRAGAIVLADAASGAPEGVDRLYLPLRSPPMERWTGPEPGPGPETAAAAGFREARSLDQLADDLAALLADRSVLLVSAGLPATGAPEASRLLARVRDRLGAREIHVTRAARQAGDPVLEDLRTVLGSAPAAREGRPAPVPAPAAPRPPATHPTPTSPPPVPPPARPAETQDAQVADSADAAASARVEVRTARDVLVPLRETKSAAEIALIRRAVAPTLAGHADAMRAARAGLHEYELAAIVEMRCRSAGCLRMAYPSIVGSGPFSCVLHYDRDDRRMEDGDLVVLDAGGEFRGYAADVTRTFPVSGRFTAEQAEAYDAVLEAQEAAIAAVRPGATLRQVHAVARGVLERHGLAKWFIHGTSHSVGLDVHDPWRGDVPLRPGCVVTVEPGVYDPSRNLGIRIEDLLVVTDAGCEVLSAALPKRRAEIEALMAEEPPVGLLSPGTAAPGGAPAPAPR